MEMCIYCHRAAHPGCQLEGTLQSRSAEIPSVPLSPGAAHQGQVRPHLASFLLTPALFCFADGFFVYFGCCRELREGKKDQWQCWGDTTGTLIHQGWPLPPALPVPAASWPVWSPALRALVRIHRCQTLCQTLQRHTAHLSKLQGTPLPPVSPVRWWMEHSLHPECHQQGGTSGFSAMPWWEHGARALQVPRGSGMNPEGAPACGTSSRRRWVALPAC